MMSESTFQREDRYIVIKRNDLKKVPVSYRSSLVDPMFSLLSHLPRRECVVVESDWPEYHLVWSMIEHRMAGKPVPDFDLWRRANELQGRLNVADQRIDELSQDKARLDALESNCWDVRFDSSANGDAGDSSINIEIVGHWMDKPTKRVIGEDYSQNLRAAIDQAMTAPAYPPARPEYPELDEPLEREQQKLPMKAHVS